MSLKNAEFTSNRSRASTVSLCLQGLWMRMQGPGGYYNLGNALGLFAGIAFQLRAASAEPGASLSEAVRECLVGSPGSTALSVSMIMFLISGEIYHRAFATRAGPDVMTMRRADFLSGLAALVLAISLVLFGSLWLALVSTVLLAGGKLGNALSPKGRWLVCFDFASFRRGTIYRECDLFRLAPALSRVPAVAAVLIEITRLLTVGPPGVELQLAQSAVLLVCYLLWARADLLLMRH